MYDQPVLRTLDEQVQPGHTALRIVDIQNDFVHPGGVYGSRTEGGEATSFSPGTGHLWEAYPLIPRALTNAKALLSEARRAAC